MLKLIITFFFYVVILTCLPLFGPTSILWTGLNVSAFWSRNRIQDQIRIRLQDGNMDAW